MTDSQELGGPEEINDLKVAKVEAGSDASGSLTDRSPRPNGTEEASPQTRFLDYLKSPVVELVVGNGDSQVTLTAHQAVLTKSPYFAEHCAQFGDSTTPRHISLPNEDLQATASVLEYLYTGEYFPRRLSAAKDSALEPDPSLPAPDDAGAALVRHARIHALAAKLRLPALKALAHGKIHRTSSTTARGELAYARFVYGEKTGGGDATLRRPVAAFWAKGSHVLRHEAEEEFRWSCLEFPQFAFDVLSLVLDQKEKKELAVQNGVGRSPESPKKSPRKKARMAAHG